MREPRSEADANVTRLPDGRIHTLIVGAGPSNLATAHTLAEAGVVPLIVEKSQAAGGLMRSIATRRPSPWISGARNSTPQIPEVDRFWREILRDDYREYPPPGGKPVSRPHSRTVRAVRGPLARSAAALADLRRPRSRAVLAGNKAVRSPRGTKTTGIGGPGAALRACSRKDTGKSSGARHGPTCRCPDTEGDDSHANSYSFNAIRQGLKLASQGGASPQMRWRHPAKGSGQIFCRMLDQLRRKGVSVAFETEVISINAINGHRRRGDDQERQPASTTTIPDMSSRACKSKTWSIS